LLRRWAISFLFFSGLPIWIQWHRLEANTEMVSTSSSKPHRIPIQPLVKWVKLVWIWIFKFQIVCRNCKIDIKLSTWPKFAN
jgi:hypothetical protein